MCVSSSPANRGTKCGQIAVEGQIKLDLNWVSSALIKTVQTTAEKASIEVQPQSTTKTKSILHEYYMNPCQTVSTRRLVKGDQPRVRKDLCFRRLAIVKFCARSSFTNRSPAFSSCLFARNYLRMSRKFAIRPCFVLHTSRLP